MLSESGSGSGGGSGSSSGSSGASSASGGSSTSRRPVLTPDPFSGEGRWDDWIEHFESMAEVNGWDEAAKLLWLRVLSLIHI